MNEDIIDVVVPLYNNFADARRLFDHIERASNTSRCRIIVVDDASSEGGIVPCPNAGGQIVDVQLIRNETNRGFAASVNRAMRQSRNDIILLNTDTLVFDGWIDRLRAAARCETQVATVTPLSNAATILSYPTFPSEFKNRLEIDWRDLNEICAQIAAPPVLIPTGIGFCMLIRRASLDAIGFLDEVSFKNGYGEECDFCRRAASSGWLNLAAPDVFVWHRGEGSFKEQAKTLRENAQSVLLQRHPDYKRIVADFIRRDPLKAVRRKIDLARIEVLPCPRRLHLRAGTPQEDDGESRRMRLQRPAKAKRWHLTIEQFGPLPNLPAVSTFGRSSDIRALLSETKISEIVLYGNCALGWTLMQRIRRAARALGIVERNADRHAIKRRWLTSK